MIVAQLMIEYIIFQTLNIYLITLQYFCDYYAQSISA